MIEAWTLPRSELQLLHPIGGARKAGTEETGAADEAAGDVDDADAEAAASPGAASPASDAVAATAATMSVLILECGFPVDMAITVPSDSIAVRSVTRI